MDKFKDGYTDISRKILMVDKVKDGYIDISTKDLMIFIPWILRVLIIKISRL
jgi:hypothetical protein